MAPLLSQAQLMSAATNSLTTLKNQGSPSANSDLKAQKQLSEEGAQALQKVLNQPADSSSPEKPFVDSPQTSATHSAGAGALVTKPLKSPATGQTTNTADPQQLTAKETVSPHGNYAREHSIIVNNIIGDTQKSDKAVERTTNEKVIIELNWQIVLAGSIFCFFLLLVLILKR